MITADQLKDVMDRADALHHYLNIDQKKVCPARTARTLPDSRSSGR